MFREAGSVGNRREERDGRGGGGRRGERGDDGDWGTAGRWREKTAADGNKRGVRRSRERRRDD